MRSEHGLVRDPAVLERAADGHRQRRGHEEHDRKQVGEPDQGLGVDEQDDRRERHAGRDRDRVSPGDRRAGVRIADRHDERHGGEQCAEERAPARVVDQLEEEEVREQQHEQSCVAVDDPEESPPQGGATLDGPSA